MRAVIQRVSHASVAVDGREVARVGRGLLVLLGVSVDDDREQAERLAHKVIALRIFDDAAGRMNLDLAAASGAVLCVSQFTLYGEVRRGKRPSYERAAGRPLAEPLYEHFCATVESLGVTCERGVFGAEMLVDLQNDGPVTIVIDTADLQTSRRA